VATGSFQPGVVSVSARWPIRNSNTDVGVNIDIFGTFTTNNGVALKMLEIPIGNRYAKYRRPSQPIIGQHRIEHEKRLQDGDVNLVGGILDDS
jgi:general secretion pathway protein D